MVKNPPANAGHVEDPLEKEMAITPVFLPGKSHGQWNLVGYSPWEVTKESDTTERLKNNTEHHDGQYRIKKMNHMHKDKSSRRTNRRESHSQDRVEWVSESGASRQAVR